MTIPYQLGPGDAVPFAGSDTEAAENLKTHDFELVPSPMKSPAIPSEWAKRAGVKDPFPEKVQRCKKCKMYAPSEAVKYPCGKVKRLTDGEYIYLRERPGGWVTYNRDIPSPWGNVLD